MDHELESLCRSLWERLDTGYAYRLAKRMEEHRTNPVLGYRTAGSRAERLTGEMLCAEMKRIGLTARLDPFRVDGWDFHHARLRWDGGQAELGGYQTQFVTGGEKPFELVFVGRGTTSELEGLDVRGRLVLIVIDQREDWWVNYPAYQAHLRGAAAVIAVQSSGYGTINGGALNAQDICGPANAPAFSLSRADFEALRACFGLRPGEPAPVLFDAQSVVMPDTTACNVVGELAGEDRDSMVLMTAHYDSYFTGFQDDNTAVAMMLGIARALVRSGYRPRRTLVFCATAAEEWGLCNSRYDWSAGAYSQIFRVHPEWQGKIVADLNLELPAHAHGRTHLIRCAYELRGFLREAACGIAPPADYPDGVGVVSPVQTWSDDFSFSIAGVPSLVNEFSGGAFMETHYHSQFDNDDAYNEDIYRFHHRLYGRLLLAFDRAPIPPLDFSPRIAALCASLDTDLVRGDTAAHLMQAAQEALDAAQAPHDGETLLCAFRFCEDRFVRLDWNETSIFPHDYAQTNLDLLRRARRYLGRGDADGALRKLLEIDNNRYAAAFEREVCDFFTDAVLRQPPERLSWGAGRVVGRLDLFDLIAALREYPDSFAPLIAQIDELAARMERLLDETVAAETRDLQELAALLTCGHCECPRCSRAGTQS